MEALRESNRAIIEMYPMQYHKRRLARIKQEPMALQVLGLIILILMTGLLSKAEDSPSQEVLTKLTTYSSSASTLAATTIGPFKDLTYGPNITINSPGAELVPTTSRLLFLLTRLTPVARPSMEELASQLGRKHLNLEHENWRLKQSTSSSSLSHLFEPKQITLDTSPDSHRHEEPTKETARIEPVTAGPNIETEQEIREPSPMALEHPITSSANSSSQQTNETSTRSEPVFFKESIEQHDGQLQTDETPIPAAKNRSQNAKSSRKKKTGNIFQHRYRDDDNEILVCHQYLQRHSSPGLAADSGPMGFFSHLGASLLGSGNQLPCSCESRKHLQPNANKISKNEESTWLSCDHVQLIGSHFYTNIEPTEAYGSSDSSSEKQSNTMGRSGVTRFSQRNSGLQTLHSQKFHYLQLWNLKYIDLSGNRIRQIKMDAFHGLEHQLEYLDLSDNFLGDSRRQIDHPGQTETSSSLEQLIFMSNELHNLKKLEWLSLRNNQISQLGSNLFIKSDSQTQSRSTLIAGNDEMRPTASTGEGAYKLSYLDLSDNLLKFVPSDSIKSLNELKILDLSRNRIVQLDQRTRFPRSLEYLDLSKNIIRTVRQCNLIDLPYLIEINLSHNQLSQLDKSAFISTSAYSLSVSHSSLVLPNYKEADQINADPVLPIARETSKRPESSNDNLSMMEASESASKQVIEDFQEALIDENIHLDRRKRHTSEMDDLASSSNEESEEVEVEDLTADESLLSSLTYLVTGRHETNDEQISPPLIERFNSTVHLNLSYNLLENIPGDTLLKFPKLQTLDLSYNRIRRLDPNYLCSIYNLVDNLNQLDLSGNLFSLMQKNTTLQGDYGYTGQISKLFGCLLKLGKLSISTNRLVSFGSSKSVKSEQSWTSTMEDDSDSSESNSSLFNRSDSIQEMEDKKLVIKFGEGFVSRYLSSLDLSDNQLKSMPSFELSPHPEIAPIQSIDVATNGSNLHRWRGSRMCCIEVLNMNYNLLERLEEGEFELLRNIQELHLDYNRLSTLPVKVMRRFTSLDKLSLVGNRISSLRPLNELFERSIRTLRELDLSYNRLSEWPQINRPMISDRTSSFVQMGDAGSQQTSDGIPLALVFLLETLNLEGNQFNSGNITNLFDQLVYLRSLKTLNLRYNILQRIKSEWFKFASVSLQNLYLTGNRINSIELGAFAGNQVNELIRLHLNYNLLKELKRKTFDSMPKIRELDLSYNLIHTINSETFNQVGSLQILRLNNNRLTSWKCEYFSHLCNSISGTINTDLASLINTNILIDRSVEKLATSGPSPPISSLIELDLSHNYLSQLRANSISVHTKLVTLNLSHNKLSFIPHDLFKATINGLMAGRQVQLVSSLRYLNLAHNRIQTIDNINFRPLKNLLRLDLSYNELQTLGFDVVHMDSKSIQKEQSNRRIIVSSNLTNLMLDGEDMAGHSDGTNSNHQRTGKSVSWSQWPSLGKLRYLNLANNQLTLVNQSLLSELSPFSLLNLNLSSNYLESESLPFAFYAKVLGSHLKSSASGKQTNYDLVYTLKLESLDLSHNRLNEFPTYILDNHYSSMESCNMSHNRIQSLVADSSLMIQIKSLNLDFNPLNRASNELILFEQRNARSLSLAGTRLFAIHQASSLVSKGLYKTLSDSQISHKLANQTSQLDLIRSITRPIDAPFMRHLNLSSNQLVWLAANVFDRMHALQTLDLSNNQLTRLNLLNNQLMRVSPSLEYLNMASNLFTSIDVNDFGQLASLRHLDISNLLSLQRMNCRFLSSLTSLRSLRMVNYPNLRQTIMSLTAALYTNETVRYSERMLDKIKKEIMMSMIGDHCFHDDSEVALGKWMSLEELELELFNSMNSLQATTTLGAGFKLSNELSKLLGPNLQKLTLIGNNLTSITEDSLIGITSDRLNLKISYTSISQLPLKQILNSLARRTKLMLDFRNNNIQLIDAQSLQLVDELKLALIAKSKRHQGLDEEVPLKLGSNPIRCDCRARPLWLWLNQRSTDYTDQIVMQHQQIIISTDGAEQAGAEQAFSPSSNGSLAYWHRFRNAAAGSDLRCYYPAKLRGKLAQYVYYNDLVCKVSTDYSIGQDTMRQQRKGIEMTKSSDTYYKSSLANGGSDQASGDQEEIDESGSNGGETDEHDYLELESKTDVFVTKFNRYRPRQSNYSLYFLNNVPMVQEGSLLEQDSLSSLLNDPLSKKSKRDQFQFSQSGNGSMLKVNRAIGAPHRGPGFPTDRQIQPISNQSEQQPSMYRRAIHLNGLNSINHLASYGGKTFIHSKHSNANRNSWLTDIDVLILTVISITMTVLSFVIITICLFKYKMDKTDEERFLSNHKKVIRTRLAMAANQRAKSLSNSKTSSGLSSINSSSDSSTKSSTSDGAKVASKSNKNRTLANEGKQRNALGRHVMVPLVTHRTTFMGPASDNFLMRSPTIKRMQGFANSASDWLKFTLRSYPPGFHDRKRRLFISNGCQVPGASSQLTTAKLMASTSTVVASSQQKRQRLKPLPDSLATGCPVHGFKSIKSSEKSMSSSINGSGERQDNDNDSCMHCKRLLVAMRRTKLQYVICTSEVPFKERSQLKKMNPENQQAIKVSGESKELSRYKSFQPRPPVGPKIFRALPKRREDLQILKRTKEVSPGRRQMRTFGLNQNGGSSVNQVRDKDSIDQPTRSQIPSDDVEGRFAYQPNSQIASPTPQVDSNPNTDGPNSQSCISVEQRDVFILVPETECSSMESTRENVMLNSRCKAREANREMDCAGSVAEDDANDDCSRTSSPFAYKFTRSPLSSTIVSSHNKDPQYKAMSPNMVSSCEYRGFTKVGARLNQSHESNSSDKPTGAKGSNNKNDSINNNTESYTNGRQETMALTIDNNSKTTGMSSGQVVDQIIVSRL